MINEQRPADALDNLTCVTTMATETVANLGLAAKDRHRCERMRSGE